MYQLHTSVCEGDKFFEPGIYLDDELPEWAQQLPFATKLIDPLMSTEEETRAEYQ